MTSVFDDRHMRRAIQLAAQHRPHPNPRVGALVVSRSGFVLAEGTHAGPGAAHAEAAALSDAGEKAVGSTLYVTLEPCAHHGRTPPCVDTIIQSGVARVVFGITDPDQRVAGKGAARLRAAGIEVVEDFAPFEARQADRAYFHHRETGMPLVTLKYAMTLDGSAAARDGSSKWITSDDARQDAHRLRAGADAVVVGAGTLISDDPRLDVRTPGYEGGQPRPVIIAGKRTLPGGASIWDRNPLVVATARLDLPGGECIVVDAGVDELPDPHASASALAEAGLLDVMLEGGPTLAAAWWRSGVVTRGVAYLGALVGAGLGIAPMQGVFETMQQAERVHVVGVQSLGQDIRVDFESKR